MIEIIVIKEYEGIYDGTRLDAVPEIVNGIKCWSGFMSSRAGTFFVSIPQSHCQEWEEEIHDPIMFRLKQRLAEESKIQLEQKERRELARLKKKYEGK